MLRDPKFGGHLFNDNHERIAAEPSLSGQGLCDTQDSTAAHPSFGGHLKCDNHLSHASDTELADHGRRDAHSSTVSQSHSDERIHSLAAQRETALVGTIKAEARRYEDYTRARQRLLLQAMATCRSFCGGDKDAGARLYKKQTPEIATWLAPYEAAMVPLDAAIKQQKKVLEKLAKQLPVWSWCEGVGGVGPYMLARIVGAAGRPIDEYRSPAALWKRFMLAVDDGKRQWKDASPAARAIIWNMGECIIKAQIRNPKGDDGKPTGERTAIGSLGQIYLDRRDHESVTVDTAGHIHNRAKRYMEKRFLRDLWRAWRAA